MSPPSRDRSLATFSPLIASLALVVVPWTVLAYESGPVTLVFAWGLVTPAAVSSTGAWSVTTLADFLLRYTAGLPGYILAWPVGVVCYCFALASTVVGTVWGREDVRVTAGLLVLAGATQASLARGFSAQPGRVAYPVGTVACLLVAWFVVRRGRPSPTA